IEALDFLHQAGKYKDASAPDLILLDLNLPRKDGREVLAEIKKDPNLRQIPVIVLTISGDVNDIRRCYNLHANCYITKPLDFDEFLKTVKSIENFWFKTVQLPYLSRN
ncbi:MAG: response regulator, partial [Planctomycetota bacterium]